MKDLSPLTAWQCLNPSCRHVIGGVEMRAKKLPLLHVYRLAVPAPVNGDSPAIGAIVAVIEGRETVTCSHCGAERKWVAEAGVKIRRRHPVV